MTPLIWLMTRAAFPIALLISMTHLVNANHGPGDGFTAGIISALGATLQYVSFGFTAARRLFERLNFERVMLVGLLVALVAALAPLLTGEPIFGVLALSLEIPVVGTVRLTRALAFDVGIYLVVFGGAMTVIETLGRSDR